MPSDYVAPFPLSPRTTNVPSGTFTVPVCTTPERFDKIMNALFYYGSQQQEGEYDLDHLVDWLAACNNIVEGCAEVNPVCRTISPTSDLLTWFPENPYHPDEEIPPTYPAHPFTIADESYLGLITWGLGYKVGDVFTDLSKTPDFTDPENINTNYLNLPSVMIDNLQGEGTVKAHLLSIPFGGRIIVIIDENPVDLLNLISVELDRDSLSFPPETAVELVIDTEIHGEGTHSIRYVWYPVVAIELPPVAFGGGVRSFELCGFGVTTMPDENCCNDELILLNKNNLLLDAILTVLKSGFKIMPITDGLIDSISFGNPCLPDHFGGDGDDTGDDIQRRADTLCYVLSAYVYAVLAQNLLEIGAPSFIESLWAFSAVNPFNIGKLEVDASLLTFAAFIENAGTAGLAADTIVCMMLAAIKDQFTTYAAFRDSIPHVDNPNPFASALFNMIYYANHQKDNYLLFTQALQTVFEANSIPAEYVCPCTPEAPVATDCNDISLIDVEGTGCTIEYISDCIWKFTQPNVSLMAGISARHFSFRDANGLNLLVTVPTDTVTYPVTAVGGCEVDGVCASPDYHGYMFGGGFAPYELNKVMWWQGEAASNVTYYKVELASC